MEPPWTSSSAVVTVPPHSSPVSSASILPPHSGIPPVKPPCPVNAPCVGEAHREHLIAGLPPMSYRRSRHVAAVLRMHWLMLHRAGPLAFGNS
jgi:hypothetical protein